MTTTEKPKPYDRRLHKEEVIEVSEQTTIQERHPDWPKLDVTFYFAPHGNYKDMEGIIPHIQDSDIFLYENIGRDKGSTIYLNKVSNNPSLDVDTIVNFGSVGKDANGKDVPMKGNHGESIVRGLYGASVAVSTLDIGKTDDENKLANDLWNSFKQSTPKGIDYYDALTLLRDKYARIATFQNQREKIMADNFEEEIDQILQSRPELKEKQELKVLISMGAYHTRLRHAFTERGIDSDHQFSSGSSYVYDYRNEVMRSLAYGKRPSEKLLMRAFTENIIRGAVKDAIEDSNISADDKMVYFRRYISQLNPDEMELIFFEWDAAAGKVTADQLNELMIDFGHPELPKSAAEILEANKEFAKRGKKLAKVAVAA